MLIPLFFLFVLGVVWGKDEKKKKQKTQQVCSWRLRLNERLDTRLNLWPPYTFSDYMRSSYILKNLKVVKVQPGIQPQVEPQP